MKWISVMCVALVLVVSAQAEDAKKAKKTPLEGTWKHSDGSERVREVKFAGNQFEVKADMDGNVITFKGTFTLLNKEKPKGINMEITDCPVDEFKGKTSLGIYQLKKGKLMWCAAHPGAKDRPAKFAEEVDGVEFMFVTLEKK